MAFSTNNGPNSTLAEINVTPLVDVMLVLLIIFMISAPLMQTGITLELPEGNQQMAASDDYMIVSLNDKGQAFLNDGEDWLQPEVLIDEIKKGMANKPGAPVYLRGDQNLRYGEVMGLLNMLREQGIESVSLITEADQG